MNIHTRAFRQRLEEAGVTPDVARAHAEAIEGLVLDAYITKDHFDSRMALTDEKFENRLAQTDAKVEARLAQTDAKVEARFAQTDAKFATTGKNTGRESMRLHEPGCSKG